MNKNFLIIGDATGRRVNSFVECLKNLNIDKYKIITWQDYFENPSCIQQSLKENTILRLEPPEKDMGIYKEILKLGNIADGMTIREIDNIDFSYCPIIAPKQWYDGFTKLLDELKAYCSTKKVFCMQDFEEATWMIDKAKTYEVLSEKSKNYRFNLPPKILVPDSYQELREWYGGKVLQCFIKLRYGSGGTGVLAYKVNPRLGQECLWTSLKFGVHQGKKYFYSGNKVNSISDKRIIEELINWVLQEGAHMEEWIPKASYQGMGYDTRVLVIGKEPSYMLTRLSRSPITNLHLRNERRDSRDILSEAQMTSVSQAAADVMQVFKNSLYAGIDIVSSPGGKSYVIDVNPFGDLFHNLIGTKENVYYQEIQKVM